MSLSVSLVVIFSRVMGESKPAMKSPNAPPRPNPKGKRGDRSSVFLGCIKLNLNVTNYESFIYCTTWYWCICEKQNYTVWNHKWLPQCIYFSVEALNTHTNNNLGLTYHAAHGRLEGTAFHYSLYIQFHLCLWLWGEVQPLVWLHWTRNELPCAHVLHHLRQSDLFFSGFCNWRHPSTSPWHRHRPSSALALKHRLIQPVRVIGLCMVYGKSSFPGARVCLGRGYRTCRKMAFGRAVYNLLFRRTSTFVVTILVGAVFFERAFDLGADRLWERMNKGVSFVFVCVGRRTWYEALKPFYW